MKMSNLEELLESILELFRKQLKINDIIDKRIKNLNDRIDLLEKILNGN